VTEHRRRLRVLAGHPVLGQPGDTRLDFEGAQAYVDRGDAEWIEEREMDPRQQQGYENASAEPRDPREVATPTKKAATKKTTRRATPARETR
jgi:hypothetical protein